jgi:hypothetical protein
MALAADKTSTFFLKCLGQGASIPSKTVCIPFHPSDTVAVLKRAIYDKEGVPPDQQRIVWNGHALENERTLADYHIYGPENMGLVWLVGGGILVKRGAAANMDRAHNSFAAGAGDDRIHLARNASAAERRRREQAESAARELETETAAAALELTAIQAAVAAERVVASHRGQ